MKLLRYALILALVAVAIWHLAPHLADFSKVKSLLSQGSYGFVIPALLAQFGQYFGDGWLSQILLRLVGRQINLLTTMKIASIDVFAAHLLPIGEAGVIATTYYFYRRLGVDNQSLIFLSLMWGISTNVVLVFLLIVSAIFLPHLPNVPFHFSNIVAYAVSLLAVLALILFLTRNLFWPKLKEKLIKFKIFAELMTFAGNLSTHKETIFNNKREVLKAALAAFIYFSTNIATLSFSFLVFGHLPNISLVTFAYLTSLIAAFVTLSPAGVGTIEATLLIIFLQFKVDPVQATASVLLFRLISFWLPIPFGILSFVSLKKHSAES